MRAYIRFNRIRGPKNRILGATFATNQENSTLLMLSQLCFRKKGNQSRTDTKFKPEDARFGKRIIAVHKVADTKL